MRIFLKTTFSVFLIFIFNCENILHITAEANEDLIFAEKNVQKIRPAQFQIEGVDVFDPLKESRPREKRQLNQNYVQANTNLVVPSQFGYVTVRPVPNFQHYRQGAFVNPPTYAQNFVPNNYRQGPFVNVHTAPPPPPPPPPSYRPQSLTSQNVQAYREGPFVNPPSQIQRPLSPVQPQRPVGINTNLSQKLAVSNYGDEQIVPPGISAWTTARPVRPVPAQVQTTTETPYKENVEDYIAPTTAQPVRTTQRKTTVLTTKATRKTTRRTTTTPRPTTTTTKPKPTTTKATPKPTTTPRPTTPRTTRRKTTTKPRTTKATTRITTTEPTTTTEAYDAAEVQQYDETFAGQYYYGRKGEGNTTFPLPSCFYNPSGYVCCNLLLNEMMVAKTTEEMGKKKVSRCNVQKIANSLQTHMEKTFSSQFEMIVSYEDFSQKIHFRKDLVCKVFVDGRYILAYATAEDVEAAKLIPTVPSEPNKIVGSDFGISSIDSKLNLLDN